MQNYAYKLLRSKSWTLLTCALSLFFISTASFSQSIEELEAEAIRQKQAIKEAEEKESIRRRAEAERKAEINRKAAAERKAAQAVATYALTINTVPATAKVSIRNIEPKYRDGMRLPAGQYQVRVEAAGYQTEEKWMELGKAAKTLTIKLAAKPRPTSDQNRDWVDELMNKDSEAPTPTPARPASPSNTRLPFEPVMVSIPAGSFTMGCMEGRDDVNGGCQADEKPAHTVSLPAFQIGKYEVTFAEWDACEQAKACPHAEDEGWGRGKHPVINVYWEDITQKYIPWLNQQTGKRYRLPTEAEWEYAARAGGESVYPWGNSLNCNQAHYGYYSNECKAPYKTVTVGLYAANAWGLYDTAGNVWEWVQDWYGLDYYRSSPASAPEGPSSGTWNSRVARGGSWYFHGQNLRSADRYSEHGNRLNYIGFRLSL